VDGNCGPIITNNRYVEIASFSAVMNNFGGFGIANSIPV
jgi:hypothetical protein